MRKLISLLLISATVATQAGTVTGNLLGPSGLPIKNGTLSFNLQQAGLLSGTGAIVPTTASCYTSSDGSVVGLPNPLANIASSINYGSGTLPSGIYFIELTFYNAQETLPSPELRVQLTGSGTLTINAPVTFPANATGMRVYIGMSSGAETLQGQTTSSTAQYSQSAALASGASVPATNTSICSIAFNDTIIPFSGYNVSLISSSGNAYPGWPQAWQLNGGASGTVNVSQGAPLWNGVTIYPSPVLMQPLNHGPQSISGSVNMTGYNLINLGELGVGTSTPSFPIDVENGIINSSGGFTYNGLAPSGHCLLGNGTAYIDSASCGSSGGQPYYFRWASNSTFVPQEAYADFFPPLVATDYPSGGRTNITLASSGVTPGTYTNPSVTLDTYGRVTAASNGNSIPVIQQLIITSGICSTSGTEGNNGACSFVANWPSSFVDTGYALTCTPGPATPVTPGQNVSLSLNWQSKTPSAFTIVLTNGSSSAAHAATTTEIDCMGIHP